METVARSSLGTRSSFASGRMMAVAADGLLGTLWVISAPSGAGKTTLIRALIKRLKADGVEAVLSVSYTTRPARPNEADGVDYRFVDPKHFSEMVTSGQFIEHAEVFGSCYGTSRTDTLDHLHRGHELFLDIDWQGARQLRGRLGEVRSVFILPPSKAELERRLRQRSQDSEATIRRRMREARAEMSHYAEYDALLVNDEFDRAVEQLYILVAAQRLRSGRQRYAHAALIRELLG